MDLGEGTARGGDGGETARLRFEERPAMPVGAGHEKGEYRHHLEHRDEVEIAIAGEHDAIGDAPLCSGLFRHRGAVRTASHHEQSRARDARKEQARRVEEEIEPAVPLHPGDDADDGVGRREPELRAESGEFVRRRRRGEAREIDTPQPAAHGPVPAESAMGLGAPRRNTQKPVAPGPEEPAIPGPRGRGLGAAHTAHDDGARAAGARSQRQDVISAVPAVNEIGM